MDQLLTPVPTGPFQISTPSPSPLKLSLILPTFNESGNISEIVKILSDLLDSAWAGRYELIVVDDNSPDRTWKMALDLTQQYPQLKVLHRETEKGLSTAVIRGWQASQGEILAVIDADLQHPPEILLQLLAEMERGADLAIASRHVEGGGVSEWSMIRRFLSRGAQMLGLVILPEVINRLSDPMSGFFMVRRSAIAGVTLSPVGYKILIEVAARGKIRWIGEVGYVFRERQAGESKVTWKQYLEYLQHLIRLRLSLSSRFIQFCLVGLTGVVLDMGLLFLLSDPSMLAWPLTRSKIIASELAIINNFLWNDVWTFGDISDSQQLDNKRLQRFFKFNLICFFGLILNSLIVNFLVYKFEINEYMAKLIAIICVTFWNFGINLRLNWQIKETTES